MSRFSQIVERGIIFIARLFAVIVGIVVVAVVAVEMADNSIVIEEISVPAELAQEGYTPSVAAHLILDEWRKIEKTATTSKRPRQIALHGEVDLAIPGVNISIESIVDYFRSKMGLSRERLRGGIVLVDSGEPQCAFGCYAFQLDLDGRSPEHFSVQAHSPQEVEKLIRDAARLAVEKLDPYQLANFYYASGPEAEPNRKEEVRRITGDILKSAPADDDPWANALLGALINQDENWTEAITYLDKAIAQNGTLATALNSRCRARAHLAGHVDEAIADCREALRLNRASFTTMNNLAFALDQKGQAEPAFKVIKCARRISSGALFVETTYSGLMAKLPGTDTAQPSEADCNNLLNGMLGR